MAMAALQALNEDINLMGEAIEKFQGNTEVIKTMGPYGLSRYEAGQASHQAAVQEVHQYAKDSVSNVAHHFNYMQSILNRMLTNASDEVGRLDVKVNLVASVSSFFGN